MTDHGMTSTVTFCEFTAGRQMSAASAAAISALMMWERIFRRSAECVRPVRHFPYAAAG